MKTAHYTSEIEEGMRLFAATLNERNFRRYAAIEALKSEHGGISCISELLFIDPETITKGIKDIQKNIKP